MRRLPTLAAVLLAACGTKGPLTLPPKPQPAAKSAAVKPLPETPTATTETPAAAPDDNSSKPAAGTAQ